jgi:hypothetical protein
MTSAQIWILCKRHHYSAAYAEYWQEHAVCEACMLKWSAAPHHVRTRGAGGDDAPENLLALCDACHGLVHAMGRSVFCKRFPHLKTKIDEAMERSRV